MVEFKEETEEIWDKWRKNEISHAQVQEQIDVLVQKHFPSFFKRSDFFERLENEVANRVHAKIPMASGYRSNANKYFSKRASVDTQIIKESDFTNFWISASWLEKPNKHDKRTIKKLSVDDLTRYHILIFRCLIDLAKNGYENSAQCRKLHRFLKLTKKAMLRHGVLKEKGDAFIEFLENKQNYRSKQEKLEEARKSGKFCPNCNSANVRSYNKVEWKCYSCGKRFRKH